MYKNWGSYNHYPYLYNPASHPNSIHQHVNTGNYLYQTNQNKKISQPSQYLNQEKLKNEETKNDLPNLLEKIIEQLNKLEDEQQKLKQKMNEIKPITIENVNYKIQDLSVQELSGTLLVGLTSISEAEELKKLLSENSPVTFNDINTEDLDEAIIEDENPEDEKNN